MNSRIPSVLLSGAMLLGGAARADSRLLTVDDAVKVAIDNNPSIRAARVQTDAANDTANSVRSHYLPAFNISEEWQHYNGPFSIPFAFGPVFNPILGKVGVPPLPASETTFPFPVREIDTNTLAVSVDQPLSGLLHIGEDHAAAQDQARASGQQEQEIEAAIREEVQTQFLRLFEARATEQIARTSQEQLNEQLTVAKSRLAAGVLTNADVLRVVVAVANARQQEIQAQALEQVSRAALLADLNVSAIDTEIDFAEPTDLENAPAPPALPDALNQAESTRPELKAARYTQSAAEHSHLSSILHILPEVDFEAAYLHVNGQEFAQVNSEFAGFKLNWTFWEWGADYYAQKAAGERAQAAAYATEGTRNGIGEDLSAKLSIERSATTAVDVAQTAISSAEEAFRVTEALLKAGSATTTDLLDSQSALTQAKLNLVRARYEQAIARVAVKRALGG